MNAYRGSISFDDRERAMRSDAGTSRWRYDKEFIREEKRMWRERNREHLAEYMRTYMRQYRLRKARW